MNDHELAARLATRAGDLLLDIRAEFAECALSAKIGAVFRSGRTFGG